MQARFAKLLEQARLANALGYASITKGMHYSVAHWRDLQQFPADGSDRFMATSIGDELSAARPVPEFSAFVKRLFSATSP